MISFVRFNSLRHAVPSIFVLALITAGLAVPFIFRTQASNGLVERTTSHDLELPNFDIRTSPDAAARLGSIRTRVAKSAADIADQRDRAVQGEKSLQRTVPALMVEYNDDLGIPEVIGTDVTLGRSFLTGQTARNRVDTLRRFLRENDDLLWVGPNEIDSLKVTADYTNPDGNLSFVSLSQSINGIPVFRGEVKAGFTRQGEIIRVINNLAPGNAVSSVSADFGDPLDAVKSAAQNIGEVKAKLDLTQDNVASNDLKTVFGRGDSGTVAEKMYFPTEPGVVIPAWRVLIWQPVNAYYVIVDAGTGELLWRKNITEDQTQSATYGVYTNPNAMINVADNPFPFTPGPVSPNGVQGAPIARTPITRIGNEVPYTFNNLGWMTDGTNITDGNAIQAGLDRDGTDGVDLNSEAVGTARTFSFSFSPFNPNTNSGDAPVPVTQTYPGSVYQQGSVTQLFYICNWYHDELYRLGFTEQAGNFQNSNFGRGGGENDRVRGEGQDSLGTNNANFSTPADGTRPRMQMYLWTGPNPDIDGNFDADVVIHEHTHGLSNRLHGNGSGLSTNMSRGMGEGWSDFYGHALLSEPTDPINGIYTTGGYDTYLGAGGFTNNYYYGIRRFPKAVRAFTGGPGNLPHNPLTFADADASQMNLNDGAYARGPYGSSTADAVHNLGEIWSSALWEIRARMINRLGWEAGNRKILQLVTDGMKLAPLGPTFLSERDAILAAAQASSPAPEAAADVADVWAGFAIRGMGAGSTIQNTGGGVGDARVTESFQLPNLFQSPAFTITDPGGNNNGFPDIGEQIILNIPLSNLTGNTATGVTLAVVGGGSADYGTMANGSTVIRPVSYTVPASATCGQVISLTLNVNSSLGASSFTRSFAVGQPTTTATQNFDLVAAPDLPAGWTAVPVAGGVNFVTTVLNPDSPPNSLFAADPSTVGGGSDVSSSQFPVNSTSAIVSFRHRYNTEPGWDGGVFEISIANAPSQDILTAGGTFLQNGYNGTLGAGTNNPIANRSAWTGDSSGYITTIVRLPAAANGQNVQLKWRFGADDNTAPAGGGWNIDGVRVEGNTNCVIIDNFPRSRADFDGDSRTDVSVFRPSDSVWYLNRSTAGFSATAFGLAADIPTPGDFDGDSKADIAVFRPSTGVWYRLNSSNGQFNVYQFGIAGDVPQSGDFDGDGKDDIAVWRPSTNVWYRLNSSDGQFSAFQFGLSGDLPVADDYDGDGKDDISVWRPSTGVWYRVNSGNGQFFATAFGLSDDNPTPGDFDGDSKTDIAVFRPSTGVWYRLNSSNGQFSAVAWGLSGDVPVPGDYDGDGKDDQAVYRNGTWYLNRSAAGFSALAFGLVNDVPIPSKYIQ